ncbi:MAG: ATP-binding cassette domain-containing protein [Ruminococcaceae bacterium]|nr:ATP-binding cassette domain-containing protein [Oscillospiraceae bacterium]
MTLKNITKKFDGEAVLDDFSCEIGENTAIMGPSGKGKTTLVRIIAGLSSPCSGTVEFSSKPMFSVVFQEDRLFNDFSAIENVSLIFDKKTSKKEAKARASELLSELLISPEEQNKAVKDFSGGMKRRVALARALAAEHDILILDEPYKGLDEKSRAVCAEVIKKYSEDKLVLMVTHDKTEAQLTGTNNVILI